MLLGPIHHQADHWETNQLLGRDVLLAYLSFVVQQKGHWNRLMMVVIYIMLPFHQILRTRKFTVHRHIILRLASAMWMSANVCFADPLPQEKHQNCDTKPYHSFPVKPLYLVTLTTAISSTSLVNALSTHCWLSICTQSSIPERNMLIGVPRGFSVGQTLKVFIAATSLAQQRNSKRGLCLYGGFKKSGWPKVNQA